MTNNIKLYDKMTITVTSNEKQDIEMVELIEKLKKAQETRESVEKVTVPKIEAIGRTKWIVIVNQLLELCKTCEEFNVKGTIGQFMKAYYVRDDDGNTCVITLEWYNPTREYLIRYGYRGELFTNATLSPEEEYCPKDQLKDKDGWLAKWDEYDIYNKFRSALMKEIQRRIEVENAKSNEILDRYAEFAKVGQ